MLHLHSERLAERPDDEPTAAEAIHLASCPACAVARRFHQQLLVAARKESHLAETTLTNWESLSPKLAAAGLIAAEKPGFTVPSRTLRRLGAIAAALAILVAGAAGGRMSAGAPLVPGKNVLAGTSAADPAQNAEFTSTAEALSVYL